jgi:hypothetical protein
MEPEKIKNDPFFMDFLIESLVEIDKSLEKHDINAALRQLHECIATVRILKAERGEI